jgi:hypothetical protein
MFGIVLGGVHDSYQQGYNQGIHDWNMFAQDLSHHFICPYNDTSAWRVSKFMMPAFILKSYVAFEMLGLGMLSAIILLFSASAILVALGNIGLGKYSMVVGFGVLAAGLIFLIWRRSASEDETKAPTTSNRTE